MRDLISIPRLELLHPKVKGLFKIAIEEAEAKFSAQTAIRIVQGLRTFPEQDALYAQGRTKPGKRVTNSKSGQSYHNYGLAIDFALLRDRDGNGKYEELSWSTQEDFDKDGEADWMEVVDSFEANNFTWGGRFHSIKDDPHFEMNFGNNWKVLLKKYQAGDFIPGTKYVNI